MRFRLALAFFVSIFLIGVASWSRFGTIEIVRPSIVAVDQPGQAVGGYKEILGDFITPKTATTSVPIKPLTNTDLIGRQLVLDYIGLAANGQDTEANINTLANNRIDEALKLHTFTSVGIQNINVVADTQLNAMNYATSVTKIYATYAKQIPSISINPSTTTNLSDQYASAENIAKLYENMARELENVPVPQSLSSLHLELVNGHLSSAAAMRSTRKLDEDPIQVIAGLVATKKNAEEEMSIFAEMKKILNDKWDII